MADEKTSIWKKEIRLRPSAGDRLERAALKASAKRDKAERKAAEKAARAAAKSAGAEQKALAGADTESAPGEKVSFWKQEISFRRKPKAAAPSVAAAPAVEPVQVPADPPAPSPAAVTAPALPADPPAPPHPAVTASAPPVDPPVPPAAPPVAAPVAAPAVPPAPGTVVPPVLSRPDGPPSQEIAPVKPAGREPSVEELIAALEAEADAEAAAPEAPAPVVAPVPEPVVAPAPEPAVAPAPAPAPVVALPVSEPGPGEPAPRPDETVVATPAAEAKALSAPESSAEPAPEPESPPPAAEHPPVESETRRRFRNAKSDQAFAKGQWRSRRHKAKKIVGVKIGASQIAAARVSNNGAIEVHQIARQQLEPGIVVAGEVRDPDALAAALKRFFRKHKLPRRGIRLGVSNNRIGVRVLEIAGIEDAEQLRNAVRFRAQEALPIPVNEAVLDYQVVGDTVDAEGAPAKRIVLVVAYRDLVDRYAAAFKKAGLKLIGIDLEAFALLRALATAPAVGVENHDGSGLVVVAVGHDRSTFAVSDGQVCEFTRVLDWGGASLDDAIATALGVPNSEAHAIKSGLSLADASVMPENLTEEQAQAAHNAVRRAVEAFARDLVSSLRFYQSQPDSLAIRELVLSGGTSELPGFAAELERLLEVRVRIGDPLNRVKVGRRVRQRDRLGSVAAAIGLGIED
jgi:type IV pilus assembly protein PilM